MEYPFPPKEKVNSYWGSPRAQIDDDMSPLDGVTTYSAPEDPFNNIADLMNFNTYAGWCSSPSTADKMSESCSFVPLNSMSRNYMSFDQVNFVDQNCGSFRSTDGEKMEHRQMEPDFGFLLNSVNVDGSTAKRRSTSCEQNHMDMGNWTIPRPLEIPLAEKMIKALSIFRESSGGGILAQVWVPIMHGSQYRLSTSEQPFLLDPKLAGYREISRGFSFTAEAGLPGRVFASRIPEWTSNVVYYSKDEYLRVHHAVNHEIRGSIALPIFSGEPLEKSCCAVLELATLKEKSNFDSEMEHVCHAFQAVNLRCSGTPRFCLQVSFLSKNQRAALGEITDVLRAVCHAHRLPLALTWIPCTLNEGGQEEIIEVHARGYNSASLNEKSILCIEASACYVNDSETQRFVHACAEHYIQEGQGVAGKALQSNHPFFVPDVKEYNISDYPLVHHARKFGLNAAVAIRLRSTYTGDDDYILEFFLPISMKGSTEQQLLLNNLSTTMQRISRSLRTVSDSESLGQVASSTRSSQEELLNSNIDSSYRVPSKSSVSSSVRMEADGPPGQTKARSKRQMEKKRSTAEKNVSRSVLQQYFSGSLKDAAKSIGVCPTTLKRICRRHGISRWPSRKINKVNRSLRKIQNVLDTVKGVDRGLKFDPSTDGVVAAGSFIQDIDTQRRFLLSNPNLNLKNHEIVSQDIGFMSPSSRSDGKNLSAKVENEFNMRGNQENEKSDSLFIFQSSSSMVAADVMDAKMNSEIGTDGDDGIIEHNRPNTSSTTNSSKGSMANVSSSSSEIFGQRKGSQTGTCSIEGESRITVKATYKEDTIRFKFDPTGGCFQLYEEVAKRFEMQPGTFQLKYMDDDKEWVMLVDDSDLQECLEILYFLRSRNLKLLVRDTPFATGSSGGSNGFLAGAF